MIRRISHPRQILRKLYLLVVDRAAVIERDTLNRLQIESETLSRLQIERETLNQLQSETLPQSRMSVLNNMRPPVFIFGPPRSGSTYLTVVMNQHERMFITSELRIGSFVNDLFRRFLKSKRMEWNLNSELKEQFLVHFRRQIVNVIKDFYLQYMPSPDAQWGDKHPHYSDPALDPGALETLIELFPDAKYIHLFRNPRNQINSYVKKGWKEFDYAVNAYRRIVGTGQAWGRKVGPEHYLEVRYEDLSEHGEEVSDRICEFLGLPPSEKMKGFLQEQESTRTPYSLPITAVDQIGKPAEVVFSTEEETYLQRKLGSLMKSLGYS